MSTSGSHDERVTAAEAALHQAGVAGARVRVDGDAGEIASIVAPDSEVDRLLSGEGAAVHAAIRALGFRYVAVDISAS